MRALSTTPGEEQHALRPPRQQGRYATSRRVTVNLTPQAIDQVAIRVAALLQNRGAEQTPELISAGELARRLRVERPWVYRHRQLLGGLRIGTGPKAPWRFDYKTAIQALQELQTTQPNRADL